MNYKIWDKQEKINNVEASYFIDSLNIRDTDGVFLILDTQDNVQAIEIDRIIKGVYELDSNLTTEEVAKEYIRIKEEEKIQSQNFIDLQTEMSERIISLEKENDQLKTKIQEQEDITLSSMLSQTEMFEMMLNFAPNNISLDNTNTLLNMKKIYSILIKKGIKNIDEVPMIIKNKMSDIIANAISPLDSKINK